MSSVDRNFLEDVDAVPPWDTLRIGANGAERFMLEPFDQITLSTAPAYLVKGLLPREGLALIWGPPKCGKSFWVFDLAMHIALGRPYRGRKVHRGVVVYIACEGEQGWGARTEAWKQHRLDGHTEPVQFYLLRTRLKLPADVEELIRRIQIQLGEGLPALVIIDTLNRTLEGSESSDQDMTAYVGAADRIQEAFGGLVGVVHHCGIEASRPRGHTSLTGAVDCQIKVAKNSSDLVTCEIEYMKDGPEGEKVASRLSIVEVGTDDEGDAINSCVVQSADGEEPIDDGQRLTKNQATMFTIIKNAGAEGLTTKEWNESAKEAGIGKRRPADLYDIRAALKRRKLVHEYNDRWFATR